MKYGYFDDLNREYVIVTPQTPLPWINYLGSSDFFTLMSNTGGGYSFYRDAKLLRLTRYRYNNSPADQEGVRFYINDGGGVWNPGWQPTQTPLDSYECRHGLGYTKIRGERNGLTANVTALVPVNDNCLLYKLSLANTSASAKSFKLFAYAEFCLWNAVDDAANFQRNLSVGEVEVEGSCVYHKTEYRERRNHYSFLWVNTDITGFDTDRDSFVGVYRAARDPQAVYNGECTNSLAMGWAPVGALQIDISLDAGEAREFIFMLGYAENPRDRKFIAPNVIRKDGAYALQEKYSDSSAFERAFDELARHWDELLSRFTLKCSDERMERMVNIWHQYQCMVTFNMSRSASFFESGTGRGMGFRDSCQDILGFVHLAPERARERIKDIAATQFTTGAAYHQYQPLTKKGNLDVGSGFNDDPLWLIACASAYCRETGDLSILRENVPFDGGAEPASTLWTHLDRSFRYTLDNLGPHGLPLIGRADWNDCLNLNCFSEEPGESFQTCQNFESGIAESVFVAGMFVKYGVEYAELCIADGRPEEAERAYAAIADMRAAIAAHGWDGAWFIRAYDGLGDKVGSKECVEGQIFIEPQGMCVMAGVGLDDGRAELALNSVRERLDCEYGIMLHQPAYTRYYLNLGEISSYPPGYKENAGVFCHNNPWISIAETLLGRGDRAFEVYKKTCPAYLQDISQIHRTEPYVYSQMVAGMDAAKPGEAKNSWLTGTAAWTFVNVSQYILGVMPTLAGLAIDPCVPHDMREFYVERRFRGALYRIHVVNPNGVNCGVSEMRVNGETAFGNVIVPVAGVTEYAVEVVLG